jgi:hypothetical protein
MREVESPDAIFIAIKRSNCAAAIAPSGPLREVVAALERDKVDVAVHSGTISALRLSQWKDLQTDERLSAAAAASAPAPLAAPGPIVTVATSQPAQPTTAAVPIEKASAAAGTVGQAASASGLPRCDQSMVATEYYVAACVVRGMELHRQSDALSDARAKLEGAGKVLECEPASMTKVNEMARLSAAKILASRAISELMDFGDAINLECKKAATIALH